MIDFKQLKYFVVCTDVGSFSEAAKILYTTQSNVSKAIKALEKTVGASLFTRKSRGIELTAQGKHVYQYACKIMEEVGALEDFAKQGEAQWLNISFTPSSWLANRFVEFYNQNYEKDLHCHIYATNVQEIMRRVREGKDDAGFVYVMGSQEADFLYELNRNQLEFVPLVNVEAMLYLGKEHPLCKEKKISAGDLKELRFIQCYRDEFMDNSYWKIKDEEENTLTNMNVAVVTNSDYIMERMLTRSRLANISGNYLTSDENQLLHTGIPLKQEDNQVLFGYLIRSGEVPGKYASAFVEFVENALKEKQENYEKME